MEHVAGTLRASDGLTLATRHWRPHARPKAAVLLVHGIGEHSGRYAHVATHLMLHGYEVFAYDHRHHGRSEGEPRAYAESLDVLVEDLAEVIAWVRGETGERPLFLMGHSLGGLIAALYVVERGMDGLAGLLLSSAALKVPDRTSPLLRKMAGLVSRLAPRLPVTRLDLEALSRDPAVVRAYKQDPLTFSGGVRARLGYEILRATARVEAHPEAFTGPLYLFHGTADRITAPDGTRLLHERAPAADKTLRLYDGFFHETMSEPEPDRQRVLDDLTAWLDVHGKGLARDSSIA